MMYVKVYSYRIQPSKIKDFLDIQERAGLIYKRHVAYNVVHLQKQDDPSRWLEIHWYPDEATYRRSIDLINDEPEIEKLWQKFQALLDPDDRTIIEEHYDQIRSEDNLSNRSDE